MIEASPAITCGVDTIEVYMEGGAEGVYGNKDGLANNGLLKRALLLARTSSYLLMEAADCDSFFVLQCY